MKVTFRQAVWGALLFLFFGSIQAQGDSKADAIAQLRAAARLNNEAFKCYPENLECAHAKWQQAIATFYSYPVPHQNMGVCFYTRYMAAGMKDTMLLSLAVLEWERALRVDPKFHRARMCLADVYSSHAEQIDFRIEDDPYLGRPVAVRMKDKRDLRRKNLSISVNQYEKIIASVPEQASAHRALGLLYEDMGDLDKAIRELNLAIMLDDSYFICHREIARILSTQGKNTEAQQHT